MFDDIQGLHGRGREAPGGIEIPSLPATSEEIQTAEYTVTGTDDIHLVSWYSGMNFDELMKLDCFTFKILLRDAYITKMRQTEEGREYLQNCWLIRQTEPDRAKLRRNFNDA